MLPTLNWRWPRASPPSQSDHTETSHSEKCKSESYDSFVVRAEKSTWSLSRGVETGYKTGTNQEEICSQLNQVRIFIMFLKEISYETCSYEMIHEFLSRHEKYVVVGAFCSNHKKFQLNLIMGGKLTNICWSVTVPCQLICSLPITNLEGFITRLKWHCCTQIPFSLWYNIQIENKGLHTYIKNKPNGNYMESFMWIQSPVSALCFKSKAPINTNTGWKIWIQKWKIIKLFQEYAETSWAISLFLWRVIWLNSQLSCLWKTPQFTSNFNLG